MNEHLQPVFGVLLLELEREGIKYWVYGGVGIAGVKEEFFRPNGDVDIFVEDPHFLDAITRLYVKSTELRFAPDPVDERRRKWEVRPKKGAKDTLSVVRVYRKDDGVEFRFSGKKKRKYPDQILHRIRRKIGDYEFFSPPPEYIKELFKTYLSNRPDKRKRGKVQKDAQKILTIEERRELQIPELTGGEGH